MTRASPDRMPLTVVPELGEVGLLIRKFYQKNQAIWQARCIDPHMTSVQYALLNTVAKLGPSSLTEIGRHAAMDPATTRGVVDRLVARGMISAKPSKRDRRKVIVSLEAPAREHLAAMATVVPQIAHATLAPLNPAETVALKYLLDKVTEHAGPHETQASESDQT